MKFDMLSLRQHHANALSRNWGLNKDRIAKLLGGMFGYLLFFAKSAPLVVIV